MRQTSSFTVIGKSAKWILRRDTGALRYLYFLSSHCTPVFFFSLPGALQDLKTRVTGVLRDLKSRETGALRDLKTRVTRALWYLTFIVPLKLQTVMIVWSVRRTQKIEIPEHSGHSSFEFPKRSGLSINECPERSGLSKNKCPERSGHCKNRDTGALRELKK